MEIIVTTPATSVVVAHEPRPRGADAWAQGRDAGALWAQQVKGPNTSAKEWRRAFNELVCRVMGAPGIVLFDAVEAGVPTSLVHLIAGATRQPVANVMDLIGVSQTTFRRKEEAREPLPDAAAHRAMGFLRVAATIRKLLEESGDVQQLKAFDLESWLAQWMREARPELGGNTPGAMLRNPEGQRAVEQLLERMRGGLPA